MGISGREYFGRVSQKSDKNERYQQNTLSLSRLY